MDTGEPLGPNAKKFVYQCGYLVRDRLPISAREWKQKKDAPHISFVSDRDKNLLWNDLLSHFTLETADDDLKELVKKWAMKKMATQFQNWKKRLYNDFIKKSDTPNFNIAQYAKLRPYWTEFVQYKTSEEGEQRMHRNQLNARRKEYYHHMGSGGYKSAIPKWQKVESDVIKKGLVPASLDWPERAKNWFFAHGGRLDLETGAAVYSERIQSAAERLLFAVDASSSGAFKPNREKDELTYAIETAEHGGRTRGKGTVPWEHGFPQDRGTYRSRQRKKDEEKERLHRMEEYIFEREKNFEERMQEEIKRAVQEALSSQRQQSTSQAGPGVNVSPPDQIKSSCASTDMPIQGDIGLRFPVDDVTQLMTSCELHIPKDNATVMVATAVVNPIDPTTTPKIHGQPIPLGYATVSVDRVCSREFNDLPLDIPGGDGEKTLGEAVHGFILWRKRYIIIPGASPPPLPPQRYVRLDREEPIRHLPS